MSTPGAARSTVARPKLDQRASASLGALAATETMLAVLYEAGQLLETSKFAPSLPAATTKREEAAAARLIASSSARE
jgi:hypothetical protein